MLEKRFAAVLAQNFTADGETNGTVTIGNTSLFKVKQCVIITATGQVNIEVEVKNVASPTILKVGPIGSSVNVFTDLSAYTVARSAQLLANEQNRPVIPVDEIARAIYDEEPVVAERVVLVDEQGNKYSTQKRALANNISSVLSSILNVTLLTANASRVGVTIFNDSTSILFLKLGAVASATSYTVQMGSNTYYEVPFGYAGQIDGIWVSANGSARIGELT